ncbi:MAG: hypothetical protein HQK66_14720 [Desulfamplus sp.]|nr:hypothetical protein [Desulfamplus sp.]
MKIENLNTGADIKMRKAHIISGLFIFSTGLFLAYLNSAMVVEFIKGAIQPVTIILGFVALASALLGKKAFRTINSILAGLLLVIGFYGLYDEYYAVLDFFYGFIPIFLVTAGSISLVYGIVKMK